MNFNLTKEEKEFLKQYAEVFEEERKRDATVDPIVIVETRVKDYTNPCYGYDGEEFELEIDGLRISENSEISSLESLEEEIRNYFEAELQRSNDEEQEDDDEEDLEEDLEECIDEMISCFEYGEDDEFVWDGYKLDSKVYIKKHYYKYEYLPVAYFLTRKEAEKYVNYQSHNLCYPRVFTAYAGYRNYGDYPVLIALLKRMGEELLKEEK